MAKGKAAVKRKGSPSSDKNTLIKKNKKNQQKKKISSTSRSNSPVDDNKPPKFHTYFDIEPLKTNKFKNLEEKYIKLAETLAEYSHEDVMKYWEKSEGTNFLA